jgi:hypothetical protein
MDGKGRGRREVWVTGTENKGEGKMALRRRIERWEKELGDCDQWIRCGTSRVALAARSDEDLPQLRTITELQIEQPEAVLGPIAARVVKFGFIDPTLMVSQAGIVAAQKRRDCDAN